MTHSHSQNSSLSERKLDQVKKLPNMRKKKKNRRSLQVWRRSGEGQGEKDLVLHSTLCVVGSIVPFEKLVILNSKTTLTRVSNAFPSWIVRATRGKILSAVKSIQKKNGRHLLLWLGNRASSTRPLKGSLQTFVCDREKKVCGSWRRRRWLIQKSKCLYARRIDSQFILSLLFFKFDLVARGFLTNLSRDTLLFSLWFLVGTAARFSLKGLWFELSLACIEVSRLDFVYSPVNSEQPSTLKYLSFSDVDDHTYLLFLNVTLHNRYMSYRHEVLWLLSLWTFLH